MKKRKRFTREFKLEAVRLLEEGKKPASDLARELGIRRNLLYKWKEALDQKGNDAFPGSGKRTETKTQKKGSSLLLTLAKKEPSVNK